jgi:hypothetical protein
MVVIHPSHFLPAPPLREAGGASSVPFCGSTWYNAQREIWLTPCCVEHRLAIELDGGRRGSRSDQSEQDSTHQQKVAWGAAETLGEALEELP